MPKRTFTDEQVKWLEDRVSGFVDAQKLDRTMRYSRAVQLEFSKQWPSEEQCIASGDTAFMSLTSEQQVQIKALTQKKVDQIYQWFMRSVSVTGRRSCKKAIKQLVKTYSKPTRSLQVGEKYSVMYSEKVAKIYQERKGEIENPESSGRRMAFRRELANELFENETKEVKAEVLAAIEADKAKMLMVEDLQAGVIDENDEDTADLKQNVARDFIEQLPDLLNQFADEVVKSCGENWGMQILVGGPMPNSGNSGIQAIHVYQGVETKEGYTFAEAHGPFDTNVGQPFIQYLQNCLVSTSKGKPSIAGSVSVTTSCNSEVAITTPSVVTNTTNIPLSGAASPTTPIGNVDGTGQMSVQKQNEDVGGIEPTQTGNENRSPNSLQLDIGSTTRHQGMVSPTSSLLNEEEEGHSAQWTNWPFNNPHAPTVHGEAPHTHPTPTPSPPLQLGPISCPSVSYIPPASQPIPDVTAHAKTPNAPGGPTEPIEVGAARLAQQASVQKPSTPHTADVFSSQFLGIPYPLNHTAFTTVSPFSSISTPTNNTTGVASNTTTTEPPIDPSLLSPANIVGVGASIDHSTRTAQKRDESTRKRLESLARNQVAKEKAREAARERAKERAREKAKAKAKAKDTESELGPTAHSPPSTVTSASVASSSPTTLPPPQTCASVTSLERNDYIIPVSSHPTVPEPVITGPTDSGGVLTPPTQPYAAQPNNKDPKPRKRKRAATKPAALPTQEGGVEPNEQGPGGRPQRLKRQAPLPADADISYASYARRSQGTA